MVGMVGVGVCLCVRDEAVRMKRIFLPKKLCVDGEFWGLAARWVLLMQVMRAHYLRRRLLDWVGLLVVVIILCKRRFACLAMNKATALVD